MAGELAIASVTAVLKDLLENGLVTYPSIASVGDVSVTALSPDRVSTGADEHSQLNLFLYRVAPNSGLRKTGKPATSEQKKQLPLALELYYLLTAFGAQDYHAEILLGCAMRLLHDTPLLLPDRIRATLRASKGAASALQPARAALAGSPLASQVEQIKITPQFVNTEEMSRLWSSLQARYRPSVAYQVSAVILDDGE